MTLMMVVSVTASVLALVVVTKVTMEMAHRVLRSHQSKLQLRGVVQTSASSRPSGGACTGQTTVPERHVLRMIRW